MARTPRVRDHAAEQRRRNELAAQRGFSSRSAERRAKGGRNYAAEAVRRNELARERGYKNRYQERKAKSPITQASKWRAYRDLYPRVRDRTIRNAELFLSGFGTQGKTGIRNRRNGYVATEEQVSDRIDFERLVQRESLIKYGDVYNISPEWWDLWREEYALEYS